MAQSDKTNGDSQQDDLSTSFPGEDFDPTLFADLYVSYEQLVATWMWACMQNKLRLYSVDNTLDINTLEREFSACAVPQDWEPPYHLRAEVNFYWPSEYTALSAEGDDAFCALYHDEDEDCTHASGSANIYTELTVEYHLPYDFVQRIDTDAGIEEVARHIRRVFSDLVDHENIVAVQVQATYADNELSLSDILARHFWILEDELHNLPHLAATFLSICDEINRVLLRFAKEFSTGKEISDR